MMQTQPNSETEKRLEAGRGLPIDEARSPTRCSHPTVERSSSSLQPAATSGPPRFASPRSGEQAGD